MERSRRFQFKFHRVFPSGQVLAQWITGLSLILNDIIVIRVAIDSINSAKTPIDRDHLPILAMAHVREATKFILKSIDSDQLIADFTDALGPEVNEQLAIIRRGFEPWEKSFGRNGVKPLRDVVFHYPDLGTDDWQWALNNLSNDRGFFAMSEEPKWSNSPAHNGTNIIPLFATRVRLSLPSVHKASGFGPQNPGVHLKFVARVTRLIRAVEYLCGAAVWRYIEELPDDSFQEYLP